MYLSKMCFQKSVCEWKSANVFLYFIERYQREILIACVNTQQKQNMCC